MKRNNTTKCAGINECLPCSEKIVSWSIAGSLFLTILKLTGGALSHSVGMTADGIESLAFTIGSMMIMYSLLIAKKKPDHLFPYGYGKVEFIIALVVFSSLIGIGFFISISSFILILKRDFAPPDIRVLPIAAASVFINYVLYRYSLCAGRRLESNGLIANAHQGKADMLSSVAVGLGIVLSQFGSIFAIFDPLAAFFVGFLILKDAFHHWLINLEVILDKVPNPGYRETIDRIISESFSIGTLQFVKFKRTGKKFWVGIGLDLPNDENIDKIERTTDMIKRKLCKNFHWMGEINFFIVEKRHT